MSAVEKPVKDCVSDGGISDMLMPILDLQLTCDDRSACFVTFLHELKKVLSSLVIESMDPEVIDHKHFNFGQFLETFQNKSLLRVRRKVPPEASASGGKKPDVPAGRTTAQRLMRDSFFRSPWVR